MDCLGSPTTNSLPLPGVTCSHEHGAAVGNSPGGYGLGQEHGDLGLNRVGVLGLVDEQVRKTPLEVVPDLDVVAQELTGPYQQVMELGPALVPATVRIVQDELANPLEDGQEGVSPSAIDVLVSRCVQFLEETLEPGAGIHAGYRVAVPVRLPASAALQVQEAGHETPGGRRPGLGIPEPAEAGQLALNMGIQGVPGAEPGEFAETLEFRQGGHDHIRGATCQWGPGA